MSSRLVREPQNRSLTRTEVKKRGEYDKEPSPQYRSLQVHLTTVTGTAMVLPSAWARTKYAPGTM